MHLSPHFTLSEMTKSQTALRRGIGNSLDPGNPDDSKVINNLKLLCLEDRAGVLETMLRELSNRPKPNQKSP